MGEQYEGVMARIGMDGVGTELSRALATHADIRIPTFKDRRTGAPNEAVATSLVHGILSGVGKDTAAKMAGVTPKVLRMWLKKGEADIDRGIESNEALLWRLVSRSEAVAITYLTQQVGSHIADDWKAAAWIAEKVYGVGKEAKDPVEEEEAETDALVDDLEAAYPEYAEGVFVEPEVEPGEEILDAEE